jgi:hypothetical protein
MSGMIPVPYDGQWTGTGTEMTGQRGVSYRDLAHARGFARLIQGPTVEKYPKLKPMLLARRRGQMELFPLPAPKRVPWQLSLPLAGGMYWGAVVCPRMLAERGA